MSTVVERPAVETEFIDTLPASLPEMSFEEFLAWHKEDTLAEWVNGRVEFRTPVNPWNNRLALFIAGLIQYWADAKDQGGEVYTDPTMMLLSREAVRPIRKGMAREPDVMYFSAENAATMEDRFLNGPADIVVEIVSPDSRPRDRHTKFFEYEKAGVREYWIHDPDNNETEFYQLDEIGKYRRIELENDTIYHSVVLPGFALDITWLTQRPLPKLMTIVSAWGHV